MNGTGFRDRLTKCLTLLLTICLAAAPVMAETADPADERDPAAIFRQATENLPAAGYELLALADETSLGDDGATDKIYAFLCRMTPAEPDAEPKLCVVVVAETRDGQVLLLEEEVWPLTNGEGEPVMPDGETLRALLLEPVAQMPTGTAGASLQLAERVADLWILSAKYDFARMDPWAVLGMIREAAAAMSEEERALYAGNMRVVAEEANRLFFPEEEPGGLYGDAGVAEILTVLRGEERVRTSAIRLYMEILWHLGSWMDL